MTIRIAVLGGCLAAVIAAGLTLASGGPPPAPAADPAPRTVVAHGNGRAKVDKPARRTDATVSAAVADAREKAIPGAVAAARAEAATLARAAKLRLGPAVGIARDIAPLGYGWDEASGAFGPDKWCGRIYRGRRAKPRFRHGCRAPNEVTVRLTITFAAEPG